MTTDYGKLVKILREKHKLPEEVVKQAPRAMAEPVMIFESTTVGGEYVMMLNLKTENGASVVVPISFNYESGRCNFVNYVPSIYARAFGENGKPNNNWFIKQIENGLLRYIDNKKSRQWALSSRLQLPWVGTHLNGNKKYSLKLTLSISDSKIRDNINLPRPASDCQLHQDRARWWNLKARPTPLSPFSRQRTLPAPTMSLPTSCDGSGGVCGPGIWPNSELVCRLQNVVFSRREYKQAQNKLAIRRTWTQFYIMFNPAGCRGL